MCGADKILGSAGNNLQVRLVTCYSGNSDEPHSSLMRTCLLSHLVHSQLQFQVTVGTYNAGYKSGKNKYMSREYLKVGFHPRMLIVNI